jgi:phosphoenolpyruvate synthase/pyruvate phosphate dikinase
MASTGFEPTVQEIESPETYAFNRTATEIGKKKKKRKKKKTKKKKKKKKKKKRKNTVTANGH